MINITSKTINVANAINVIKFQTKEQVDARTVVAQQTKMKYRLTNLLKEKKYIYLYTGNKN